MGGPGPANGRHALIKRVQRELKRARSPDGEDAVMQVAKRVWQRIRAGRPPQAVDGFFTRSLENYRIDQHRSRERSPVDDSVERREENGQETADEEADPVDECLQRRKLRHTDTLMAVVDLALADEDERDHRNRLIFVERVLKDDPTPIAELARRLKMSKGAVRMRQSRMMERVIKRVRKKLRDLAPSTWEFFTADD